MEAVKRSLLALLLLACGCPAPTAPAPTVAAVAPVATGAAPVASTAVAAVEPWLPVDEGFTGCEGG